MKYKKLALTVGIVTLLASGTSFAADINTALSQSDTSSINSKREADLENLISDLSEDQKTNILNLQSELNNLKAEERNVRQSLFDALSEAGIEFSKFRGDINDFIEKNIDSLSSEQQAKLKELKQQIEDLKNKELEEMGIDKESIQNENKENLDKPKKRLKYELTDEQKAIKEKYKQQIEPLETEIKDILKEAGIELPKPSKNRQGSDSQS